MTDRPGEVLRLPAFALFWSSSTLGAFTGAVSALAFQVLIVKTLNATPLEIGLLNAANVVPYLLFGLIVGALMDRWRRKPAMVLASIGRALVLGMIPVLWVTDTLTVWSFGGLFLLFGALTLIADSAAQPMLPRLVPRNQLVAANARLGQAGTVAQTTGPALGGAIVSWLGAPIAILVDAVAYLVSAVMLSRIRVEEPKAERRTDGRHLGHDIVEGVRWTYSHRTLAPMAASVNVWFLGNSIALTAFVPYALRELDLGALLFGLVLAMGGVGGFLGAVLAPMAGRRFGVGGAVLAGRALSALAWLAILVLPASDNLAIIAIPLGIGQFLFGLGMGLEDPNEMGYRQAVAPDAMQGRLNASIRTVNRVMFLIGALVAGGLATAFGYRVTIAVAVVIFVVAAFVVLFSPLRTARHEDS
ncbi:MFS transporter [Microbacterium sp. W4I20]|uniref:MFS transporter n=1 Tax=Microbacterium sp. W4I20 TaxID=3042262 RepID=UPI00277E0A13|nr:MFS transporter [Microbacterium sp. W4I20]MDQ0727420.1 MFS family permease [Microbacterium sp. W4I20]